MALSIGISEPQDVINLQQQVLSYFTSRDNRITRFRDLVRQIDWVQRKKSTNYESFEGNESGSFFSAMVQLLSKNSIRHRIPLEGEQIESERELVGAVERLIQGTYRDIDDMRPKRMESGSLQQAIAQFACSDGWVLVEVIKNDDDEEKPLVDMRVHDNLLAHPLYGPDGLFAVFIRSDRTKAQVALEYPQIDLEQKVRYFLNGKHDYIGWGKANTVEVQTIYHRLGTNVYYGVVINGQWAIKPYKLEWIDEIPVAAVPVNGLPYRTDRRVTRGVDSNTTPSQLPNVTMDDWLSDVGRGIFFMNESLYPKFNELWSKVLDIVENEARSTYNLEMEEEADDEFDASSLKIGRGGRDAINVLPAGRKLTRIPPGGLSREVVDALGGMSGMLQRGGISWQLLGQPMGDQSGFAIAQLMSAASTIAVPYQQGIETTFNILNGFIIKAYQFSKRKTQTVRVLKEDKSFVTEEIDLSLLKGRKFYFKTELKPALPDDLANRINVASVAKRDRLLSELTIADDILGVDDPELELDRKLEDDILSLPSVRLRRAAALALERGDRASAVALMQELMLLQANQGVAMRQAQIQLAQLEGMMNPNQGASIDEQGVGGAGPGGGTPPASPLGAAGGAGLPPETLPPEQAGVSPQAQRAIAENLIAGLTRRGAV